MYAPVTIYVKQRTALRACQVVQVITLPGALNSRLNFEGVVEYP